MTEHLIIRPSAPAELGAIQAIYAAEVLEGTASFELEPPDLGEIEARRAALLNAGYPHLVALLDDSVVGFAYAGPYRSRPAYRYTVESSVYVAAEARRRGIGASLLERLIHVCERSGYREMVAVIGDSAHRASIGLHRQAGFRLVGTLESVGYKFDRWLDSVLMQRRLGADALHLRPCEPKRDSRE